MADYLDEIRDRLTAIGVDLTVELVDRAAARLAPASFAGLFDRDSAPVVLGAVWQALLDRGLNEPESDLVTVLAVHHAATRAPGLAAAHLPEGLNWRGTWLEINIRLAGTCYDQHRQLLASGGTDDQVRGCLAESFAAWDVVEPQAGWLRGRRARIWRGQRAVAGLVLARKSDEPDPLLLRAVADFAVAFEFGDNSNEHFCYRIEALKRLLDLGHDVSDEAEQVVAVALGHGAKGREWLASLGDLRTSQGVALGATLAADAVSDGESERTLVDTAGLASAAGALARYTEAVGLYTEALLFPAGGDLPDGLVRAKRGVARQRIAWIHRLLGQPQTGILDEAIADLRYCGTPGAKLRGLALPAALLQRARELRRDRQLDEALALATEGHLYCLAEPEQVPEQLCVGLAALRHGLALGVMLLTGAEVDAVALRVHLDGLSALPPDIRVTLWPMVGAAVRLVYAGDQSAADRDRIAAVVDRLRYAVDHAREDAIARWLHERIGRLCAHLGSAMLTQVPDDAAQDQADSTTTRHAWLRGAYSAFRSAMPPDGEPSPELWWALGLAALHYAKSLRYTDPPESQRLLAECVDCLTRLWDREDVPQVDSAADVPRPAPGVAGDSDLDAEAESQYVLPVRETASYLGEAFLRLHSFTRASSALAGSITWLERSAAAGNESEAMFGLLGDAHYRHGRETNSPASFQIALAHKARARAAGLPGVASRENWSVSAASHRALWELRHDPADFVAAVGFAWQAAATDRAWPWPMVQLLDLRDVAGQREISAIASAEPALDDQLTRMFLEPEPTTLRAEVANRAARNRQFQQHVLGGRSQTFVLDDPHRLLSVSLVIKPTSRELATAEAARTTSLDHYLRSSGAPHWMQLPVVVDAVDIPTTVLDGVTVNSAYVTRRALGRSLAELTAARRRGPALFEASERALRFLARIHCSQGGGSADHDGRALGQVARVVERFGARAGIGDPTGLASAWTLHAPPVPIAMPGRDGHAENWLVTPSGGVTALDFEDHPRHPLLYEAVQLIEDHALLPPEDGTRERRLGLCRAYLDELALVGEPHPFGDDDLWQVYRAFAFVRAVFLAGYLPRKMAASDDPGFRHAADARYRHARQLIVYLADTETRPELRDVYARAMRAVPTRPGDGADAAGRDAVRSRR
ncbi:hypothetical protein [Longispora urticae]